MAVFRQVHTSFWQDPFVLDLTPEEKYFYLYLMTNTKTSACGIYELPKKIIELETGYNRETVDKLIQRFIDYGKILYSDSTKEIMLINWLKYNNIKSPTTQACIKKEIKSVKNKEFISQINDILIPQPCPIDTPSIPPLYTRGEKEKEKDKEHDKDHEKNEFIRIIKLSEKYNFKTPDKNFELYKLYSILKPNYKNLEFIKVAERFATSSPKEKGNSESYIRKICENIQNEKSKQDSIYSASKKLKVLTDEDLE